MLTRRSVLTAVLVALPMRSVYALCPSENALRSPPVASRDAWGALLTMFLKSTPSVHVKLPLSMFGLQKMIDALQDATLEEDAVFWMEKSPQYRSVLLLTMIDALEEASRQSTAMYCVVERMMSNASLGALEVPIVDVSTFAAIRGVVRLRLRERLKALEEKGV